MKRYANTWYRVYGQDKFLRPGLRQGLRKTRLRAQAVLVFAGLILLCLLLLAHPAGAKPGRVVSAGYAGSGLDSGYSSQSLVSAAHLAKSSKGHVETGDLGALPLHFGGFKLIQFPVRGMASEAVPQHEFRLRLSYADKDLDLPVTRYSRLELAPPRRDFPKPGHQTLLIKMQPGMSSSYNSYLILTLGPDGDFASFIPPAESLIAAKCAGNRYLIQDPAFGLNALRHADTAGESAAFEQGRPKLWRLLVFDDGRWRVDRPGELPCFYRQEIKKMPGKTGQSPLPCALRIAYYQLMAGDDAEMVKRQLAAGINACFAAVEGEFAFQSVLHAVIGFDPVEVLL